MVHMGYRTEQIEEELNESPILSVASSVTIETAIPLSVVKNFVIGAGGNVRTRRGENIWLNSSSNLPPVECPLMIEVGDVLVPATRTGIIPKKSDDMEYRLENGCLIHGRYRWTYP